MLSSLKEKLLHVKKNVNLFNNLSNEQDYNAINKYIGADIVNHFQEQWQQIHNTTEKNANEAEIVANCIENLNQKVERDKNKICQITQILSGPTFTNSISNCLTQIQSLYEVCNEVENDLILFQDVIENLEIEKMKQQHLHHLKQYEIRKKDSLKQLNVSLEESYKESVEKNNLNKQKQVEERQRVYQEAFKHDLEAYKSKGSIPKNNSPNQTSSALLEEIQLDFDQNVLDQFFEENS